MYGGDLQVTNPVAALKCPPVAPMSLWKRLVPERPLTGSHPQRSWSGRFSGTSVTLTIHSCFVNTEPTAGARLCRSVECGPTCCLLTLVQKAVIVRRGLRSRCISAQPPGQTYGAAMPVGGGGAAHNSQERRSLMHARTHAKHTLTN